MYKWQTIQKDGTELKQNGRGGLTEEERKNCKIFSWVNEKTGHKVSVDLTTGSFKINEQVLLPSRGDLEVLSGRNDIEYRLVYATRHFLAFGDKSPEHSVGAYIIGWQATLEGKNIKRLLYIKPSGEIVFAYEG